MTTKTLIKLPVFVALIVAMLAFGLPRAATPVHAAGSLQLPRATVPQGATVVVNGSGFTSPDNATVYIDAPVSGHSQHIQTTAVVGSDGSFSAKLALPRAVGVGVFTLTAKDAHGTTATTRLTIGALLVVHTGAPTAATTAVAHLPIFIDALGFAANETVRIQATFPTYSGNDVVVTRTPNADGQGNVFNAEIFPPNGAKVGWASVTAAGQNSNKQAPGRIYLTYRAYITLVKSSVVVGNAAGVVGHAFVSYSNVRVQITINSSNGQQTLTVNAFTDANGNFTKYLTIPSYANPGTYTVVATGLDTGQKHYARLNVSGRNATATPKPTAKPTPQPTAVPTAKPLHSVVSVFPAKTLPNQRISVTGTGFPANATVNISSTVDLRGGGNRQLSRSVFTDSNGGFSVSIQIPFKAAQGTYGLTATSGSAHASGQINVLPFSAHPSNLNFRWVSLWYHTVRHDTYDVIAIQSTLQTTLGIWAHVIFPNGQRHDYYTNTDGSGHFQVKFSIPHSPNTRHSNQAYITLQLWHGQQTTQAFIDFTTV